jgi:hypothetical protein
MNCRYFHLYYTTSCAIINNLYKQYCVGATRSCNFLFWSPSRHHTKMYNLLNFALERCRSRSWCRMTFPSRSRSRKKFMRLRNTITKVILPKVSHSYDEIVVAQWSLLTRKVPSI